MSLPDTDLAYLKERSISHQAIEDAGMTCILLPSWQLPAGYDRPAADLLLRLPAGYPDIAPDMWWFDPALTASNGKRIPATDVTEQHIGRSWQRWSRHLQPGQWKSGIDSLESYIALINRELTRSITEALQ